MFHESYLSYKSFIIGDNGLKTGMNGSSSGEGPRQRTAFTSAICHGKAMPPLNTSLQASIPISIPASIQARNPLSIPSSIPLSIPASIPLSNPTNIPASHTLKIPTPIISSNENLMLQQGKQYSSTPSKEVQREARLYLRGIDIP